MGKHETLRAGFKHYLATLSEPERNNIPAEFQPYLLSFTETDSPDSVGGWYVTHSGATYQLQKWHSASGNVRVGASVTATESNAQWRFSEPTFIHAHKRLK